MKLVLLTALGVGFATVLGAIIGFSFKKISSKTLVKNGFSGYSLVA